MHYTGEIVKRLHPDAVTVFIGPCVAKRMEGLRSQYIDFVLTAEELAAMFQGAGIDISKVMPDTSPTYLPARSSEPSAQGTSFAVTKGVGQAVASFIPAAVRQLMTEEEAAAAKETSPSCSCQGSCVDEARRELAKLAMHDDPHALGGVGSVPCHCDPPGSPAPCHCAAPPGSPSSSTSQPAIPSETPKSTVLKMVTSVPSHPKLPLAALQPDSVAAQLKPVFISGLDKAAIKQLQTWGNNPSKCEGNLIECMACEGGCVAGPGSVINKNLAGTKIKKLSSSRPALTDIEDVMGCCRSKPS